MGIITEHDGLRLAQALVDERLATAHCGSSPVACVEPTTPTTEAWATMTSMRIRHLCVVNEEWQLRGVISHRDLVREGTPIGSPVSDLLRHQLVWTVGGDATVILGDQNQLQKVIELILLGSLTG